MKKEITNTVSHENCVTEQNDYLPRAKKLKREHDKWEKDQKFEVNRIDSKTVKFRRIKPEEVIEGMKIHKGII